MEAFEKNDTQNKKMYMYGKRLLDIILALVLLILAAIPMIIVAIAIHIEDGEPVIYGSLRMGKGLKPFKVYKFRSMKTNRKELESELTHEEMVTKVGKFIRKTSIDELPQLINVLKGEMSFIGPRPWVIEYYDYFTEEQKHRTDVLPGISGLAQVRGRNGISVFEKIDYDLYYVENISFIMDVKMVIETVLAVFKGADAEITERGIKDELNDLKNQHAVAELNDKVAEKQAV